VGVAADKKDGQHDYSWGLLVGFVSGVVFTSVKLRTTVAIKPAAVGRAGYTRASMP
jgi:hypothetical protein